MARAMDITIGVNLSISDETAVACLKLVELYVNSNPDFDVSVDREQDGTLHFYYTKRRVNRC